MVLIVNAICYLLVGSLIIEFLYYSTKGELSLQGIASCVIGFYLGRKFLLGIYKGNKDEKKNEQGSKI